MAANGEASQPQPGPSSSQAVIEPADPAEGPRYCSNTRRCRTPLLPDGWAWKLCRACQEAKNATNRANRSRKRAAEAGEDLPDRPPRRRKHNLPPRVLPPVAAAAAPTPPPPAVSIDDVQLPDPADLLDPALPTFLPAPSLDFTSPALSMAVRPTSSISADALIPLQQLFRYVYPVSNSQLKAQFKLKEHPEGGFSAETGRAPDPADGDDSGQSKVGHSTIHYLLTPTRAHSYFHRHAADSLHFLHQGRARFTCLKPPEQPGGPHTVQQHVLGMDFALGETMQFTVPAGWWRFIELLDADLERVTGSDEHVGMFMSEVCVPGFSFDNHEMMTSEQLQELCEASDLDAHLEGWRKCIKQL